MTVRSMPRGVNTSRVMNVGKGSPAAASTTALRRIQPLVESGTSCPAQTEAVRTATICSASSRLAQSRAGMLSLLSPRIT